jgi:hypothetical protein
LSANHCFHDRVYSYKYLKVLHPLSATTVI